jgi:radical SAM protein with 4Fe4S-binding SPASM domain
MACPHNMTPDEREEYLRFSRKVIEQRIPIGGSIEITRQCNFDCIHCYLGEMKSSPEFSANELNAAEWMRIIDEIVDAGCLYLLFTGGDPLIRDDFSDIYRHARKRGLIVTVFTNGSLITDEVLAVFSEYPPNLVEISIYGASSETYKAVTRRADCFGKCMANIRKLIQCGIQIQLKTVLMTKNRHEFDEIRKISEALGVKFRFDAMIFPCLNGDAAPIDYRVSPVEVAERNMFSNKNRLKWKEIFNGIKRGPLTDVLYDCGAGSTNFHIDPCGMLSPCLMVSDVCFNLSDGSFLNGWHNVMPKVKEKKNPLDFVCKTCEYQILCSYCPAFFKLETGSEVRISKYLCDIGHEMGKKLMESG